MNAITKNVFTGAFASIGKSIPRHRAVLVVFAHWYVMVCAVTANPSPRTIHDFGGFPEALYQLVYSAPGSPELALRITALLAPVSVRFDQSRGFDHGTWSVLTHVFPGADIPVIQLGINATQPPDFHHEIGKRLVLLREENILIIGSGNFAHNLSAYAWGSSGMQPFDWAMRFENMIRELLLKGDDARVVAYEGVGRDAMLAVPTPEHYLPMLDVLGLRQGNEQVTFPVQGFDGGSVSMLAVRIG